MLGRGPMNKVIAQATQEEIERYQTTPETAELHMNHADTQHMAKVVKGWQN